MAELHRGVFGLPHRAALAALLAIALAPMSVSAQEEITVDVIVGWAADLRGDDAAKRREAYERLGHLPESALPAIAERIEQTRRQIVPTQDGYDALRYFRHAVGSRRADDMVDIAPGILPVLEERRTREVGRVAERLLLLRSLEAIGTVEAQRRIADVFSLTNAMWRWEQRRIVDRMGVRLLPGMILARGHDDRGVRLWARGHIRNLGMKDPANALRVEDPELLAEVINAYAEIKDLDTMPIILSYVGHEDRRIREAARAAFETFGRNGIWQLREGIRKQLGERPDARWGWRRTMRALFEGLDERRLAPYATQVDDALTAMTAGEHARAKEVLDGLLRDVPHPPRVDEVASIYAQLAEALDDPQLLRRAVWLAPEAPDADGWRARLALIDAEADRARGIVDAESYREALRHDPSDQTRELASEVLGDDEAEAIEPSEEDAGGSMTLLGLLMLLVAAAAIGGGAWLNTRRSRPKRTRPLVSFLRTLLRMRERLTGQRPRRTVELGTSEEVKPLDAALLFGAPKKSKQPQSTATATATTAKAESEKRAAQTVKAEPITSAAAPTSLTQLVLGAPSDTLRHPGPPELGDGTTTIRQPMEVTVDTMDEAIESPDTEPGIDTQPGLDEHEPSAIADLMLARPQDVDTLPGVPAP